MVRGFRQCLLIVCSYTKRSAKWYPQTGLDCPELIETYKRALGTKTEETGKRKHYERYRLLLDIAFGEIYTTRFNGAMYKLLEDKDHEPDKWLDRKTPQATGQIDWIVETVDEIDGSKKPGR